MQVQKAKIKNPATSLQRGLKVFEFSNWLGQQED
jgi:hypothetical protein